MIPVRSTGGLLTIDHLPGEEHGDGFRSEVAPNSRETSVFQAHADVRTVIRRTGALRLGLLVPRCPGGRQPQLRLARLPFLATMRSGACVARHPVHAVEAPA